MIDFKWFVLAVAVLMYTMVIIFQSKKVWFTTAAAIAVVLLGTLIPDAIFPLPEDIVARGNTAEMHSFALLHSIGDIVNWNVLMIYLGSMIIAALFIYSKVPARIADFIVEKSRSTGLAMVAILAMTGINSIFVENVATVLVMAPIALALSKKLNMNPTMFMIGLAVMSNMEGTATLVGDPPSMIFASYAGYNFNDFFFHAGKLSVFFIIQAGLLVGCAFFYIFFAKAGKEKPALEKTVVVSWFPLFLLLAMIFGLAGISFVHTSFAYLSGTFVLALGILGLVWYKFLQNKSLENTVSVVKELDWETIFFLIGIFIVIGAIEASGLLQDLSLYLAKITGGSVILGFLIIIMVSIIISGFVDNVPYIIAMLPVADGMAKTMGINGELYLFALLIGSCMGGNLTPFGASANIVSMGIIKREGYKMNFADWVKVGVPFTILTTGTAAIVLWLLWA